MEEQQQEEKFMREYIIYLCHPGETMLILALNFAEAWEIAEERWTRERVVQIVMAHSPVENAGGLW